MLVLFQRHVIYMPYLPPNSRSISLSSIPASSPDLRGITVEDITVKSEKRIRLSGLLVRHDSTQRPETTKNVIVYLQGNAGSPPHRLPVFKTIFDSCPSPELRRGTAILAVAPRNYWTSSRKHLSQRGILADYEHVVRHAFQAFPDARIAIYGHSIGATIALCLLSTLQSDEDCRRIRGLILENAFTSCADMLLTLYPNKWVPYRYLGSLIWDKWDARSAVVSVANQSSSQAYSRLSDILSDACFMVSEHDEVVPREMGEELYKLAQSSAQNGQPSGRARLITVGGALHENAFMKRQWSKELWNYLKDV